MHCMLLVNKLLCNHRKRNNDNQPETWDGTMETKDSVTRSQKQSAREKKKREDKIRSIFWPENLESEHKRSRLHIAIPSSSVETIKDIRKMHEVECWKYVPDVVLDVLFNEQIHLRDEDPTDPTYVLTDREIVRMSLELLRLYLMGADHYNRRLLRQLITAHGQELKPEKLVANVESGAKYTLALDALLELREQEEVVEKINKEAMKSDDAFDFNAAKFLDD